MSSRAEHFHVYSVLMSQKISDVMLNYETRNRSESLNPQPTYPVEKHIFPF